MSFVVTKILLVSALCVALAHAHAIMIYPAPYCNEASRTFPCGCAGYDPEIQATWNAGSIQGMGWNPINGDGIGELFVYMDTTGTMNFNFSLPTVIPIPVVYQPPFTLNTWYAINISLPENLTCTGPENTCVMMGHTPSGRGWYSCSTVRIVPSNYTLPPMFNKHCYNFDNQNYTCQQYLLGASVNIMTSQYIPYAPGMDSYNEVVTSEYYSLLNGTGTSIFTNSTHPDCPTAWLQYLCDFAYPPCEMMPNFTKWQADCEYAMDTCGATAAGRAKYNNCMKSMSADEDPTGSDTEGHTSQARVLESALLFSVTIAAFAFALC